MLLHVVSPAGAFEITVDIDNTLHAPGFGVLAVLTFVLLRSHSTRLLSYFLAFAVTISVSFVSELMQMMTARDSSPADFANDVVGIVSFLLISAVFDARARSWISSKISAAGFYLLVLVGFVASMGPLIWHFTAFELRRQAAPAILDFESRWQSKYYGSLGDAILEVVNTPEGWHGNGRRALLVKMDNEDYSGFHGEPISDWSSYTAFSFIVASADNRKHRITVRIHDFHHNNKYVDRFSQSFAVTASPKRISIPITAIESGPRDRPLQIDKIASFGVFISNTDGSEELLLDDFQLN